MKYKVGDYVYVGRKRYSFDMKGYNIGIIKEIRYDGAIYMIKILKLLNNNKNIYDDIGSLLWSFLNREIIRRVKDNDILDEIMVELL